MTNGLDIYVSGKRVARLERSEEFLYRFSYLPGVQEKDAVSLVMPVDQSYDDLFQVIPPALQVNLPEGYLLNTLQETVGKALKLDDDLDILALVGRHTVGRVQLVPEGEPLESRNKPLLEQAESLLRNPDARQILSESLEKFAQYTGLSGVLPKGFARKAAMPQEGTFSVALSDAILKMETEEYPGVCAVEHACLELSRNAGIPTVESKLSDTGEVLLVKRFDVLPNGDRLGFEDFCALTGVPKTAKYKRDLKYVANVLHTFSGDHDSYNPENLENFFALTVLNTAVQNGDAHLKNFGVLYENPVSPVRFAPAYDLVSTTTWIPRDLPALPMGGISLFPTREELEDFGRKHCHLSDRQMTEVFERVAQSIVDTQETLREMETGYPEGFRLRHLRGVSKAFLEQQCSGVQILTEKEPEEIGFLYSEQEASDAGGEESHQRGGDSLCED